MEALIALLGGVAMVLAPYFCYKVIVSSDLTRTLAAAYAVSGLIGFLIGYLLATAAFAFAVISTVITVLVLIFKPKNKIQPDFVVEGPLLKDAVSMNLEVELQKVERAVKEGDLEAIENDTTPRHQPAPRSRHPFEDL